MEFGIYITKSFVFIQFDIQDMLVRVVHDRDSFEKELG